MTLIKKEQMLAKIEQAKQDNQSAYVSDILNGR